MAQDEVFVRRWLLSERAKSSTTPAPGSGPKQIGVSAVTDPVQPLGLV